MFLYCIAYCIAYWLQRWLHIVLPIGPPLDPLFDRLVELLSGLSSLQGLESLDMSGCPLKALPENFCKLQAQQDTNRAFQQHNPVAKSIADPITIGSPIGNAIGNSQGNSIGNSIRNSQNENTDVCLNTHTHNLKHIAFSEASCGLSAPP